jgi:hypothetical protein
MTVSIIPIDKEYPAGMSKHEKPYVMGTLIAVPAIYELTICSRRGKRGESIFTIYDPKMNELVR